MSNAFTRFQGFIAPSPTDVVTITSNNGDGTSQATTPSGSAITVKGESVTAGNNAFVRDSEIIRQAPNLTPVTVNV